MTFIKDINKWNITQTASTMFFKLPETQAFVGSAGEIRIENIKDKKYLTNSIFGNKAISTLGVETTLGTFFNYTGTQSIKGLEIGNSLGNTGAETSLFYLNYSISTSLTNISNESIIPNNK